MLKKYFSETKDIEVSISAEDGKKGIILLNQRKDEYDIVILDIVMPNKDGISVLEYMYTHKYKDKQIALESLIKHRKSDDYGLSLDTVEVIDFMRR